MSEPYRTPSGTDESAAAWPRWPAFSGLRLAVRYAVSRSGARFAWRWSCIIIAYILMPLSLALHNLRGLGGADPERTDAAAIAAKAWDMDHDVQPLPMIGGSLVAVGWLVLLVNLLVWACR